VVNETVVTMIGNVASPVQYGQTAGGVPMANFRLAATERRYDRVRGEWVDGDTLWATVVAWRGLALNVVSSLDKGDPVMVSGRLRVREWEDQGKRRSVVEVDARAIGHDLGRGTSAFRRTIRERPEQPGLQSAGEAVPEWIAQAVRERRALGGQSSLAAAAGGRIAGEPLGWAADATQGGWAAGELPTGITPAEDPSVPVERTRRRAEPAAIDAGQPAVTAQAPPGLVGDPAAEEARGTDGEECAGTGFEVARSAATAARSARAGRSPRSGRGGRRAEAAQSPVPEEEPLPV
jgi:single-strand DNA-binding protein